MNNWKTIKKIKKNMYKHIKNVKDKEFVYLPTLTKGLNWKNTVVLSSSSELKTSQNEGFFKNYVEKLDDNSINIICNSYKNETVFESYPMFEIVRQEGDNIVWYHIPKQLEEGITIYTNRIMSIYFDIAGLILASSTYTPLNIKLYANGNLIQTFTDITKLDRFYVSYLSAFHGMMMAGTVMYIEPIDGKIFIQLEQEGDHGQANMVTENRLQFAYIDATREVSTENDIHFIAYEET